MMNYALRITHYELEQWFQQFNHDYFHDKLPMPRLKRSKSKTRLGSFACRRKLTWRGYQPVDFSIRISTYYQMTERQVQNVLLHEMIHYYIAYMRLRDTSAHGTVFRQLMDELNRKGWEITVSTKTKGWETTVPPVEKKRIVLAMKTSDGKYFLSVVNPKYVSRLEQQIKRVPTIVEHAWIESSDDRFRNYPQVRSLRGRRVSRSEYEAIVCKAQ